ncbi:MAG: RNA 2',3'-cyclic phosphodiesterase [Chloroflexota bacterium]|nr:RNA 2',3'-cyclic phosphodiesterase [Chloroflexota bacterium]
MTDRLRCFIAIELPDEVKLRIEMCQDHLKKGRHEFVKWVNPQGIHLTLAFLGDIQTDLLPRVEEAMDRAVADSTSIDLAVDELGVFPGWKQPRVVWLGIKGDIHKLELMHDSLSRELISLGYMPESRGFKPHLTLGRIRDGATSVQKREFGEWVSALQFDSRVQFKATNLSLMQSILKPSGAIYNRLNSAVFSLERSLY